MKRQPGGYSRDYLYRSFGVGQMSWARLSDYWAHISRFLSLNIVRLPLDEGRFRDAQPLRQAHGLLTNDSLLLAAAARYGISHLATNDADFERVPWLTVYKPGDIP